MLFVVALTTIACSSDKSSRGPADSSVTTDSAATEVSTTVAETTTTVAAATTVPPTTPATPAPGPVPGAVTITYAGFGGGSGETEVHWNAVSGATGYKVYRGPAAGGPFTLMAVLDVATGDTTLHSGVLAMGPNPSEPGGFLYLDFDQTGIYVRVRAYNANGQGPGTPVCITDPYGASTC